MLVCGDCATTGVAIRYDTRHDRPVKGIARMLKSERLMAITLMLQGRGKMTADRLASILEVSARTIYRDMDALSLAHVPVAMDYGPGGGYYLPDGYRLDPMMFTS